MKTLLFWIFIGQIFCRIAFAQPANSNVSNGLLFDGEPYLAINPSNNQNLIAAWIGVKFINGAFSNVIKTKSSFDGGITWSAGNNLPHFNPSYGSADPSIAFSTNGTAFLAYIDHRESPDSGGVFVARSTNGGLNWDIPTLAIDMYDDPSKKPIDRPWLEIDNSVNASNGTLYLTSMPPSWIAPPNRAIYKVSTDGGFNWTALANVDGGNFLIGNSIAQPMATPSVTKFGELIVAYPSFVSLQNPLPAYYLAKSSNQGQSFSYSSIFSSIPAGTDANFKKGYLLLADPSDAAKMVFLLPDGLNGDSDIEALHSNDGGMTWSNRIRVNDDPISNGKAQDMVWGAYNETGDLVVTWRDRRNSNVNDFWNAGYDFYYATSSDNGQTFGQNQKLSSQFIAFDSVISQSGNDFMSCAYSGDTLYSIWGDTRNGKMNIYFAKTLASTNSTISLSMLDKSSGLWEVFPNPAQEKVSIQVDKQLLGTEYFIYNAKGQLVKFDKLATATTCIEINSWEEGQYIISIQDETRQFLKN